MSAVKQVSQTQTYLSVSFPCVLLNSEKQFLMLWQHLLDQWMMIFEVAQTTIKNPVEALCGDLKLAMWQAFICQIVSKLRSKAPVPLTTAQYHMITPRHDLHSYTRGRAEHFPFLLGRRQVRCPVGEGTKSDGLSWIPRTHMVGGQYQCL